MSNHIMSSIEKYTKSLSSPSFWVDSKGDLCYINSSFQHLSPSLRPMSCDEAVVDDVCRCFYHFIQKSLRHSEIMCEDINVDHHGFFTLSLMPTRGECGSVMGVLGTLIKSQDVMPDFDEVNNIMAHVLQDLPANIFWQDLSGVVKGCNQRQAESLGFSRVKDVIGLTLDDLFLKESAQILLDDLHDIASNRKKITKEEKVHLHNSVLYGITTKAPLFDDCGVVVGVVGTSIDMTGLKEFEDFLIVEKKRLDAMRSSKNEFITNIRHDFRTPLSGIIGYAESLRSVVAGEHKERIDILVDSSRELLVLINHILESSMIQSGDFKGHVLRFSFPDMLMGLQSLYSALCSSKNIYLNWSVSEDVGSYWGDYRRIKQILIDLISNAVNFTDQGGVTVTVRLHEKNDAGVVIYCAVTDTGIGMDEKQQEVVFNYFSRLTPSCDGKYPGLGLGLWRVKMFASDLGGDIRLSSEPKIGTTVTCMLPLSETNIVSS